MESVLRNTLLTFRPDEVAFVYIPKERINKDIFTTRFGQQETEEDGVTYSLTESDLQKCFGAQASSTPLFKCNWVMSITPLAARTITSVAFPSDPLHTSQDNVIALNAAEHAEATVGMMLVHFIREKDANAFKSRLENA